MAKRAICVGINKFANYPQFALNGCVNDANDMAALCKQVLGYKASEVTVLTDAKATKAAIMAALTTAVKDAKAGKISSLLFAWSSHGTQMTDTSGDEPDGKDEAFVPYDIAEKAGDWDPAHIISDDEFHDLFSQLPANVLLEVYLDTCHSGSGLRGAEFGLHAPRARFVAPPSRQGVGKQAAVSGFTLAARAPAKKVSAAAKKAAAAASAADGLHHILWSGCKADQTSADAYFSGRYNGAFTYHYIKVLRATNNSLSRAKVITQMRTAMKGQFSQTPQLETSATNRNSVVVL
jgi:metacaspase-1